jgi:hypothetical protein
MGKKADRIAEALKQGPYRGQGHQQPLPADYRPVTDVDPSSPPPVNPPDVPPAPEVIGTTGGGPDGGDGD